MQESKIKLINYLEEQIKILEDEIRRVKLSNAKTKLNIQRKTIINQLNEMINNQDN